MRYRNPANWFRPALAIGLIALAGRTSTQNANRTIEEIKVEAQTRADRSAYPLSGLDPVHVRDALAKINTRDPDDWAAGWSAIADRYMAKAKAAATPAEADANYLRAWRLYCFG